MSPEPEEDFLDTDLRNVFHDYDLPLAEHSNVWAGVEARIAPLPTTPVVLTSRLLLPLTTAVLGMAVGWLLPHPDARPVPAPGAALTAVRAATPAPPLSLATERAAATPTPVLAKVAPPTKALSRPMTKLIAKAKATRQASLAPTIQAKTSQAATGLVVLPDSLAAASSAAAAVPSAAPLAAGTDSLFTVAKGPTTTAKDPSASSLPVANGPAKVLKPKGSSEKIGYHKPSNRQSEQNRGIRRWFSHLAKSLRHLVGGTRTS